MTDRIKARAAATSGLLALAVWSAAIVATPAVVAHFSTVPEPAWRPMPPVSAAAEGATSAAAVAAVAAAAVVPPAVLPPPAARADADATPSGAASTPESIPEAVPEAADTRAGAAARLRRARAALARAPTRAVRRSSVRAWPCIGSGICAWQPSGGF